MPADERITQAGRTGGSIVVVGPGESGNKELGAILGRLRELAGLSRADAAARLGFSVEYLRLIETGNRAPALGQMPRFLNAYHAAGGVRVPQPGGPPADLIVYLRPDDPILVMFRSRIREARGSGRPHASGGTTRRSDEDRVQLIDDHPAQLGIVVSLLTQAGPDTLRRVRDLLEEELG